MPSIPKTRSNDDGSRGSDICLERMSILHRFMKISCAAGFALHMNMVAACTNVEANDAAGVEMAPSTCSVANSIAAGASATLADAVASGSFPVAGKAADPKTLQHSLTRTSTYMNNTSPIEQRAPNFAFYYGRSVPVSELSAFDAVVVEPDSDFDVNNNNTPHTTWFAYTSLGEVNASRPYFKDIPRSWVLGENKAWNSTIIDLSVPQWPAFYVDHVIAPLWERGFRNFFLDTLDSYRAEVKSADEVARQEAGAVAVIRAIKKRYPSAQLALNRGFELLPEINTLVYAVAFESLYRGWDQGRKRYVEVAPSDRDWLITQVQKAKAYGLPVVAIDYCPPDDLECARDTVRKIRALDVIPYVTVPTLDRIGIGAIIVEPRRILVLQDGDPHAELVGTEAVRYLGMPLNYLGYRVDYLDATQALPQEPLNDRYAGIVLWMNQGHPNPRELRAWLAKQIDIGMHVAVIGNFGMPIDRPLADRLDLRLVSGTPQGTLAVESRDTTLIGFEAAPRPDRHDLVAICTGPSGRSLLRLKAGDFEIDAAAITRWGGYVMRPFAVAEMPEAGQARWVVQPLAFLRQALRLPQIPVPDTTTETGRRLFMTRIDGEGFGSLTELGGTQQGAYASDVLLAIVRRYGWPTTVSVTESDFREWGARQASAPPLRFVAQRLFALPNVEIAVQIAHNTHASASSGTAQPAMVIGNDDHAGNAEKVAWLPVRGLGSSFDVDREVAESIARIASGLAPTGKYVQMVFWGGDSQAPVEFFKAAHNAGVLSMDGGDTLITKRYPSWTAVSPLAVMRDGYIHVFAPNQSEARYTNYWQGPYYGFERVLETFDMTGRPIRFKPVEVSVHMYTGAKYASIAALERVYQALSAQSLNPLFTSEYVRKVQDFFNFSVARNGDTWVVRDAGQLRTVRLDPGSVPDLSTSVGVAGYVDGPGGVFVHMTGSEARFNVLHAAAGEKNYQAPYVADTNGRIERFVRNARGLSFDLYSHVEPAFRLVNVRNCRVMADGRPLATVPSAARGTNPPLSTYALERSRTKWNGPETMTHVDIDCGV